MKKRDKIQALIDKYRKINSEYTTKILPDMLQEDEAKVIRRSYKDWSPGKYPEYLENEIEQQKKDSEAETLNLISQVAPIITSVKKGRKSGGKNSKRKPDPVLMKSAMDSIKCFREKFNNYCDLKDTHSVQSLYNHMVICGFIGKESWVKKHFDTIAKLS